MNDDDVELRAEPKGASSGNSMAEAGALGSPSGLDLDLEASLAIYRPVGAVAFEDLAAMIRDAIATCAARRIRELLVDTTGTTGFDSPSTLERFAAVDSWASAGMGRVRLALIARVEHIDPNRFGVTVAINRGLSGNIFTSEAEARAWLDSTRPGDAGNAPDHRGAP